MNRTNFNQTGGFPLKTERLDELQTSYDIFNSLGNIAGNLVILSGCEVTGSNVAKGVVFINGEVYPFAGGYIAPTVVINSTTISKEFEEGGSKPVHTLKVAGFGTASESWAWTSFKRPLPTNSIPLDLVSRLEVLERKNAVFQAGGGMVLWNKPANQIPAGWQEVADWRGRMPVGFDSSQYEFNTVGKVGGAKSKTLSVSEMPSHTHTYTSSYRDNGDVGIGLEVGPTELSYNQSGGINYTGGNQSFPILNPYRVVLFIEFIG
jgi:hypothetical protein